MQTIHEFGFDGREALRSVVIRSGYKSFAQAIASLTLFSHPETVAQTSAKAIFPTIRNFSKRGDDGILDGRPVGYDDNTSPTQAFTWANGLGARPKDLQFNHIYSLSQDPESYTNLANICVSPAFLAKLTDTDDEIPALLKYRAFDLFGWHPLSEEKPEKPGGYDGLVWADTLPAMANVKEALRREVATRNNQTTRVIAKTGWLFG